MELLPTPLLSMDDLDPDDEHSQELLTVSYIFPELKILSNHAATISIPVAPEPPISVVFHDDMTSTAPRTIPHLPPLQLAVVMPEKYPQEAPPDIKLASLWLSEDVVLRLRTELVGLWKDSRDQVLYAMIDHLVQAAERGFDQADGSAAVFPKILEEELISFNKMMLKNVFNQGTYECGVCLEPKKGTACHSLFPCHHVFCISCLQDFYTVCITEGDVSLVKCLDPTCILNKRPKAAPQLPPPADGEGEATDPPPQPKAYIQPTLPTEELEDLGLSQDLVTRYRMLKRKAALDADPKTIYCPRTWCQAPSRSSLEEMDKNMGTNDLYLTELHFELRKADMDEGIQKGADVNITLNQESAPTATYPLERMDRCSSCSYAFCKVCSMGWHGDYVNCRPKNAPKTAEELATEEFLKSASCPCPTCEAAVIKSHGCNHMTCRCGTHFCFLCGAYLLADNPYRHYSDKDTRCYMMLWVGEEGDGLDPMNGLGPMNGLDPMNGRLPDAEREIESDDEEDEQPFGEEDWDEVIRALIDL